MELTNQTSKINIKSITEQKKCFLFHNWYDIGIFYRKYETNDVNYKYGIQLVEIKECINCGKIKTIVLTKTKLVFHSNYIEKVKEYEERGFKTIASKKVSVFK